MSFEVQILGSNSAAPAHGRHHTAQSVRIQSYQFLVDCGEGTQLQMRKYGVKKNRLSHIFISHLHGDHYLGLMGLLSTMHLNGRKQAIDLYGPIGLAEIITTQLKYSNTKLSYPLHFHEIKETNSTLILDLPQLSVYTIPLSHRIQCNGFLFKEKLKPRKLIKEKLAEVSMKVAHMNSLKRGEDVMDENGELLYAVSDFTMPPKRSRSYAYCSDTIYHEDILPIIKEVDINFYSFGVEFGLPIRARGVTYGFPFHQTCTICVPPGHVYTTIAQEKCCIVVQALVVACCHLLDVVPPCETVIYIKYWGVQQRKAHTLGKIKVTSTNYKELLGG